MAQPRVFVSHSHVDDAFAERLVTDLRAAGVDAWLDKENLGAGDFQERISVALGGCEWFVLVLTSDALESKWVRQEVHAANSLKHQGRIRDLIFIKAGAVDYRDVPALWNVYNMFDATLHYANACDSVLRAGGVLRRGATGESAPRAADGDKHRGENFEQPVEITLREAYVGARRLYTIQQPQECADCNGMGKADSRICVTCSGTGLVEHERRITVHIPAGVDTGMKVRVAGEGQPSPDGGPHGDLYLLVTVKPDPQFERRGLDLVMEAPAPLTTFTEGGELSLTLIDGKRITLTIPPRTQNGQVFRVPGKGMPLPNSDQRGNLLVRLQVELP